MQPQRLSRLDSAKPLPFPGAIALWVEGSASVPEEFAYIICKDKVEQDLADATSLSNTLNDLLSNPLSILDTQLTHSIGSQINKYNSFTENEVFKDAIDSFL
tara:strand:- start:189 stop:494 length:306 start_codon:yes stop_codon:yes gene_type:complete